ncbi:MAG: hypothetical protein AAGC55_19755, partial [Myxococcota bacterium]
EGAPDRAMGEARDRSGVSDLEEMRDEAEGRKSDAEDRLDQFGSDVERASDVEGHADRGVSELASEQRSLEDQALGSAEAPGELDDARRQIDEREREASGLARDPERELQQRAGEARDEAVDQAKSEKVGGTVSADDVESAADDPREAAKDVAREVLDD